MVVPDRDERGRGVPLVHRAQPWQVQPAVQRRHHGRRDEAGEREGEVVEVIVNDVELVRALGRERIIAMFFTAVMLVRALARYEPRSASE